MDEIPTNIEIKEKIIKKIKSLSCNERYCFNRNVDLERDLFIAGFCKCAETIGIPQQDITDAIQSGEKKARSELRFDEEYS